MWEVSFPSVDTYLGEIKQGFQTIDQDHFTVLHLLIDLFGKVVEFFLTDLLYPSSLSERGTIDYRSDL